MVILLNTEVKIKGNGFKGKVIGVWESVESPKQYNVRFFDTTGRPCDFWFLEEELENII